MTPNELIVERGKTHGTWDLQAAKAVEIKRTFEAISSLNDSQYEALQQIAVKISRILTGNPNCADHWADIAGYATLVANELSEQKAVGEAPGRVNIIVDKVRCVIAPNGLDVTVGNVYDVAKPHDHPDWLFLYNDLNKIGSYRVDYFVPA